jgi:RNA polymerase sigma-70 factor (ECF subfamily)
MQLPPIADVPDAFHTPELGRLCYQTGCTLSWGRTVFIRQMFTLGAEAPARRTGAKAATLGAEARGLDTSAKATTEQRPAGGTVPMDREDTLVRARNGDTAAFATLIRQHQRMVFSLALHVLRSRTAAEDLAQEVFLELYRHLSGIESAAHATSWLRRVTSHRCIDEIRRRRHRRELAVDILPERGVAPVAREFFLEERLQSLVATLPPRARMVVVLRFQEELDPSEIADALRMPLNTVKSHLRRSLNVLRARLTAERGTRSGRQDTPK